jgi:hypothetical protein
MQCCSRTGKRSAYGVGGGRPAGIKNRLGRREGEETEGVFTTDFGWAAINWADWKMNFLMGDPFPDPFPDPFHGLLHLSNASLAARDSVMSFEPLSFCQKLSLARGTTSINAWPFKFGGQRIRVR